MTYRISVVLMWMFLSSCASTHVPFRWLPEADQAPSNIYGGWVEIESRRGEVMGELIAVAGDTLFVADTSFHAIGSAEIVSARLVIYDPSGWMGLGMVVGTVSTVSNGWFLVFTAPMWLIGGSIAVASRTFDPIIDYPDVPLKEFVPFARYPQGLPQNLDRGAIKMKSG